MTRRERWHEALVLAAQGCEPVSVDRRADPHPLYGCVVEVSPKWVLLHHLEGVFFLNGYVAVRMKHVRKVKRLTGETVVATGLRHFGEEPRPPEEIDLSSTRALLLSAGAAYPLVTIHTERRDPDVCYVGRPEGVDGRGLRLREITPAGEWRRKATHWRLSDITRIDFGGRYEVALDLVGGAPS